MCWLISVGTWEGRNLKVQGTTLEELSAALRAQLTVSADPLMSTVDFFSPKQSFFLYSIAIAYRTVRVQKLTDSHRFLSV
ncbi:hypothetical protein L2E82_14403 [Cichorium intybus]|uniref:Uncharacterized protein n=1 Tax=Cichorium intybus TaxID=13427 RepID=A0ACB9F120_CICIN|nr:hypothetical protein L2E82_14403 [Cichorium intybus]